MRSKVLFALSLPAAVFAVVVISVHYPAHSSASSQDAAPAKQPVIVELFTSEGCSSCPPADSLLEKLSHDQPFEGIEILALEEHVDYWNHLGWTDRFSSAQFSERQQQYSETIKDGGVYTPQMVVDGRVQFLGGRTQDAHDHIRWAASVPKALLRVSPSAPSAVNKKFFNVSPENASTLPSGAHLELWVAVTEKNLKSDVIAGENSGHSLQHAPVVRVLRKIQMVKSPLSAPIPFDLDLKENWDPANLTVIAFLAQKNSHQILAAGSSPITR